MNDRDVTWLCPKQPFGHAWKGGLRCSLCGAERSAADAIVSGLGGARGWGMADAERVMTAHRAEVRAEALAEAIEAARAEYLTDDTGTDEDAAYNQGVTDAIAAISALVESGAA